MKKSDFYKCIEALCPNELAEDWDNCGIQIDTDRENVDRVLVALEITEEVLEEALDRDADMILTHHPLLFSGLRTIRVMDPVGDLVYWLIRNLVSVYSCHTSFDIMKGGNNDYLGNLLGIAEIQTFEESGLCRKGVVPGEMTLEGFVQQVAERLAIDARKLSVVGEPGSSIRRVGWCTGSGAEFIPAAAAEGLDLFLTGDLKYHQAQEARALGICVIDAGHYGTEKCFVENMAAQLADRVDCEVLKSGIDIDPFV